MGTTAVILSAATSAGSSTGGSPVYTIGVFALIFVVFYFLFIRPQRNRMKQQIQLQNELELGDRVVTAGGIVGIITAQRDSEIDLQVAPGVEITFMRQAIRGKAEPDLGPADSPGAEPE
jgi:preprotein translocase subunit YajC